MTQTELNHLLRAVMDMEHSTKESLTPKQYDAMCALAMECEAPGFVIEYFARKALGDPATQE
jgi:hypothetical protein